MTCAEFAKRGKLRRASITKRRKVKNVRTEREASWVDVIPGDIPPMV
jgi:hypothetical protein